MATGTGRASGDHVRWAASVVLAVGLVCLLAVAVSQAHLDHVSGRTAILGCAAVLAGITVAPASGRASVSASFLVVLLAAALLGPASACGCALVAEFIAASRLRTPRYAVAFNALGVIGPALAA